MKYSFQDIQTLAQVALDSGFFKKLNFAKILTIMQIGTELGFEPMASIRSIHVMNGKPTLSAHMLAGLAKRAGYEYTVTESEGLAVVEWSRNETVLGTSSFSMADAKKAKLIRVGPWTDYPKAMLKARALADGARTFAPEACAGLYTEDEVGSPKEEKTDPGEPALTLKEALVMLRETQNIDELKKAWGEIGEPLRKEVGKTELEFQKLQLDPKKAHAELFAVIGESPFSDKEAKSYLCERWDVESRKELTPRQKRQSCKFFRDLKQ